MASSSWWTGWVQKAIEDGRRTGGTGGALGTRWSRRARPVARVNARSVEGRSVDRDRRPFREPPDNGALFIAGRFRESPDDGDLFAASGLYPGDLDVSDGCHSRLVRGQGRVVEVVVSVLGRSGRHSGGVARVHA